jgi:hypothetical protein
MACQDSRPENAVWYVAKGLPERRCNEEYRHENQSRHCLGSGQTLTIEEVDLEGPRAGEVLVEVKATGICHTDYYTLSGADPEGIFPAILGHEGAGVWSMSAPA